MKVGSLLETPPMVGIPVCRLGPLFMVAGLLGGIGIVFWKGLMLDQAPVVSVREATQMSKAGLLVPPCSPDWQLKRSHLPSTEAEGAMAVPSSGTAAGAPLSIRVVVSICCLATWNGAVWPGMF